MMTRAQKNELESRQVIEKINETETGIFENTSVGFIDFLYNLSAV